MIEHVLPHLVMKPAFENLTTPDGSSIRCFDRSEIIAPLKWHYHPEVELTLVEQGPGTRYVGDSIERYENNDLVLVGSSLPHHWSSDEFRGQEHDRHAATVIQFHPTFLGDKFFDAPELNAISTLLKRAHRGLQFSGGFQTQLGTIMKSMVAQSGIDKLRSLLDCLVKMVDATSDSNNFRILASASYTKAIQSGSQDRLHQVFEFIDRNLFDPDLTQAAIALSIGMNPSALSRFFKATTQRTITDYICELRVGHAARLLVESEYSVLEICGRVGFENPTSFARRFRSFRGFSPSEFRKQFKHFDDKLFNVEEP